MKYKFLKDELKSSWQLKVPMQKHQKKFAAMNLDLKDLSLFVTKKRKNSKKERD